MIFSSLKLYFEFFLFPCSINGILLKDNKLTLYFIIIFSQIYALSATGIFEVSISFCMSIKYICIWKESPHFNPVRVAQSFLLWIMFCRSLFVLLILLGHCIVCPSSIYGFWLCIWYLQNFSSSEWKGAVVMENQWTALIPNSKYFFYFV